MNRTEEYLDSLLNNVSPERKAEAERKRRRTSEDFIRDFENELRDDEDLDDVFSDFDDDDEPFLNQTVSGDSFFHNLEGIVNTAKGAASENKQEKQKEETFEVNTLEDDSWTEPSGEKANAPSSGTVSKEEQELNEVLSEIPTREDVLNFAQKGDVVQEDEEAEQDSDAESSSKKGKKASNQKKKGLFAKISAALFGKNDEEAAEGDGEDFGGKNSDSPKKQKKKKEKKPKEKKAKEKKPKEKKPKKPKEKKPKKPKEVDLSPPLPKVPVFLIFVMSFSVMIFVVLSSNLMGYSTSMTDAKTAYYSSDYVSAYQNLAGLSIKEEDEDFAEQVRLLALVQEKMTNGDALYLSGQYKMALDSYICALGRYDVNNTRAEAYQIEKEYEDLKQQIIIRLQETFGVSADTAIEIYGLRDRKEYTRRVYTIVKNSGLIE